MVYQHNIGLIDKRKLGIFGTIMLGLGLALSSSIGMFARANAAKPQDTGFDQYGYNRTARVFNGTCKSWAEERMADPVSACGADYVNDKLIMKWNSEWDRGNLEGWTDPNGYDAWLNNEWNGRNGGSGETYIFKTAWDPGCVQNGVPSISGDTYCIWDQFAVLLEHYSDEDGHVWLAHALPAGYGNVFKAAISE